jgi:hypothetical protein
MGNDADGECFHFCTYYGRCYRTHHQRISKEFAGAKDVQWETGKAFVKATFTLHGQVMFAYYSNDASLLAVTRNITTNQLPMGLLTDVKKNYANYWISDLFEMVADNETSYYVTLESADSRVVLKSTDSTTWQVYKKKRRTTYNAVFSSWF